MESSLPLRWNRRTVLSVLAGMAAGAACGRSREPGPVLEVSFHVPDEPVPRSFSSFRGRVILVGFWTAGCTMCDQQLAILSRLHDKYSSAGLVCVGLYDLGQTFTMAGVTILQGAIESSQAAELPKERPAVLVLDREGRLVEKYSQLVEDEDLEKLVQPLLGV